MTHRARMLAALRGAPTDRIPWAPRLDLWYRAQRQAGTLPTRFRDATLMQITDALDMGFHAVVPDFLDLRAPDDDRDRALGIYNLWAMPCRTVLHDVRCDVSRQGDHTAIAYHTPYGVVRTRTTYDDSMRRAGITITHVSEPAIKSVADFKAVGHIFEHAAVVPNYAGYTEFADRVGERGVAVGFVNLWASPLHLVMRDLMPVEAVYYALHDHPAELANLLRAIDGYGQRQLTVAVDSPAPILLVGANYDAMITYPPLFAEYFQPWLKRYADALHARGRYLLTHTDGENTGLLSHYLAAGVDIADSICPQPMTRLSLRAVRETFAGRITIMGGFPSIGLLPESLSDDRFEAFLDDFFSQVGRGDHLILGISDTTPPAADFERLLRIGERVRAFGPVGG